MTMDAKHGTIDAGQAVSIDEAGPRDNGGPPGFIREATASERACSPLAHRAFKAHRQIVGRYLVAHARREETPAARSPSRAGNVNRIWAQLGQALRDVAAWTGMPVSRRPPLFRVVSALVAALLGCVFLLGAARADEYLHRGIESGDELPLVRHLAGRELGVNADLRERDPDQLDAMATALADQGIRYVRQPFVWASIETEPDAYDWSPYDAIVSSLNEQGIAVIALITSSPDWASGPLESEAVEAPPRSADDLGTFVDTLIERYAGQVEYIQLWDRPNDSAHWGGRTPDPRAYADMLATTATAARQRDPAVHVITAELTPGTKSGVIDDLDFLTGLYRAGAAPFFDAVAVALPGGRASPFDRWVDAERMTMSRAVRTRETMIDAGDPETPVWATTYPMPTPSAYDASSRQADFGLGGLERARSEWPWLGPILVGELSATNDGVSNGENSLVGVDGLDPTMERLVATAGQFAETAAPGLVPSGAPALEYQGDWSEQTIGTTAFKSTTEQGASVTVRFEGTGVAALLRRGPSAGEVRVSLDGGPLPGSEAAQGGTIVPLFQYLASDAVVPLASGLEDREHTLTIELSSTDSSSSEPLDLTFGGIVVSRTTPADWPVAVLAGVGIVAIWFAVRELLYVLAIWAGWLRRHRELDLGPPLGEWDVARRA